MNTKIRINDIFIYNEKRLIEKLEKNRNYFQFEIFEDSESELGITLLCIQSDDDPDSSVNITLSKKQAIRLGKSITLIAEFLQDDED